MNDRWFLEETAYRILIDMLTHADNFSALNPVSDNLNEGSYIVDDQGVARIPVIGIMSKGREAALIRMLLGESTTYNGLISALAMADSDSKVVRAVLDMDTPGGNVNGAFEAARAIQKFSKPIDAVNNGQIASAGYLLASQADKIIARNPSDMIGSIGVVTRRRISDTFIDISSTDAPYKAPDASTNEGINIIRQELDMLHGHLVTSIAEGRGINVAMVNSEFGRGGMMTSDVALKRGMIDAIEDGDTIDGDGLSGILAATSTYQDFEIVNRTWDSRRAMERVRRFTQSTEAPSRDYRKAFFWYDRSAADKFGSYKLPFVDVVDNRLVAVRQAINAANAAMAGARGGVDIPEADRPAVQRHINRYREKIRRQDENNASNKGGKVMNLASLLSENSEAKKEHDDLIARAIADERIRVIAHLENIDHSKDAVIKAIKEGDAFNSAAHSVYMNAAIKKQHGKAAAEDNPDGFDTDDGGDDAGADAAARDKALSVALDGMTASSSDSGFKF